MSKDNYIQIGKFENGIYEGECTENGVVFKSEESYLNHPDTICYIPEYGFLADDDFCGTIDTVLGYTRNELLELYFGNQKLCDALFYELSWEHPETFLSEIDEEELINN